MPGRREIIHLWIITKCLNSQGLDRQSQAGPILQVLLRTLMLGPSSAALQRCTLAWSCTRRRSRPQSKCYSMGCWNPEDTYTSKRQVTKCKDQPNTRVMKAARDTTEKQTLMSPLSIRNRTFRVEKLFLPEASWIFMKSFTGHIKVCISKLACFWLIEFWALPAGAATQPDQMIL